MLVLQGEEASIYVHENRTATLGSNKLGEENRRDQVTQVLNVAKTHKLRENSTLITVLTKGARFFLSGSVHSRECDLKL